MKCQDLRCNISRQNPYIVIHHQYQLTPQLTTTVSTFYVFLKLIMYNREVENNTFETYGILLASFVLCWVEVWLFETKVRACPFPLCRAVYIIQLHRDHDHIWSCFPELSWKLIRVTLLQRPCALLLLVVNLRMQRLGLTL